MRLNIEIVYLLDCLLNEGPESPKVDDLLGAEFLIFMLQVEAPIHSSNVMHYSKTAKVASRVGHKTLEDGSRVRFLLKTGEVIDSAEEWKKVHKKKEGKKE